MNLILLEADDLSDATTARVTDRRAAHIHSVLKAAPGDSLRVGRVDGPRGTAEVVAVAADDVTLRCRWDESIPPRPEVDLLLAVPRPKVLKRLWAQLAALGVGRIALVNAARVERCYFDTHVLDPGFYRPLLIEGLQQAGDTRVPEVSVHRAFRPFVEDELEGVFGAGVRLVADPGAEGRLDARTLGQTPGRVLLAVGPEGGWVPFERELLQARGFVPVSLGPRVLRTDTACVALLALAHARRD